MKTTTLLSIAALLVACARSAQPSRLDAIIAKYAPGASLGMNVQDFLRLPGASSDGNGGLRVSLGDSAGGFTLLSGRFGAASEPLDSLALPRRIELHAEGTESGAVADSVRKAISEMLGVSAFEACSGRGVVPLRVSWWKAADGILFLQSSEGQPIASLGARARLVAVPRTTDISNAVGTETSNGPCAEGVASDSKL